MQEVLTPQPRPAARSEWRKQQDEGFEHLLEPHELQEWLAYQSNLKQAVYEATNAGRRAQPNAPTAAVSDGAEQPPPPPPQPLDPLAVVMDSMAKRSKSTAGGPRDPAEPSAAPQPDAGSARPCEPHSPGATASRRRQALAALGDLSPAVPRTSTAMNLSAVNHTAAAQPLAPLPLGEALFAMRGSASSPALAPPHSASAVLGAGGGAPACLVPRGTAAAALAASATSGPLSALATLGAGALVPSVAAAAPPSPRFSRLSFNGNHHAAPAVLGPTASGPSGRLSRAHLAAGGSASELQLLLSPRLTSLQPTPQWQRSGSLCGAASFSGGDAAAAPSPRSLTGSGVFASAAPPARLSSLHHLSGGLAAAQPQPDEGVGGGGGRGGGVVRFATPDVDGQERPSGSCSGVLLGDMASDTLMRLPSLPSESPAPGQLVVTSCADGEGRSSASGSLPRPSASKSGALAGRRQAMQPQPPPPPSAGSGATLLLARRSFNGAGSSMSGASSPLPMPPGAQMNGPQGAPGLSVSVPALNLSGVNLMQQADAARHEFFRLMHGGGGGMERSSSSGSALLGSPRRAANPQQGEAGGGLALGPTAAARALEALRANSEVAIEPAGGAAAALSSPRGGTTPRGLALGGRLAVPRALPSPRGVGAGAVRVGGGGMPPLPSPRQQAPPR